MFQPQTEEMNAQERRKLNPLRKAAPSSPKFSLGQQIVWRFRELLALALVGLSLFLWVALLDYDQDDPGWTHTSRADQVHNSAGAAGAWFADVSFTAFGLVAYLFPILCAFLAFRVFYTRRQAGLGVLAFTARLVGMVLLVLASAALAEIHFNPDPHLPIQSAGGALGKSLGQLIDNSLNTQSSTLIFLGFFLVGISLFANISWFGIMDLIGKIALDFLELLYGGMVRLLGLDRPKPKRQKPEVPDLADDPDPRERFDQDYLPISEQDERDAVLALELDNSIVLDDQDEEDSKTPLRKPVPIDAAPVSLSKNTKEPARPQSNTPTAAWLDPSAEEPMSDWKEEPPIKLKAFTRPAFLKPSISPEQEEPKKAASLDATYDLAAEGESGSVFERQEPSIGLERRETRPTDPIRASRDDEPDSGLHAEPDDLDDFFDLSNDEPKIQGGRQEPVLNLDKSEAPSKESLALLASRLVESDRHAKIAERRAIQGAGSSELPPASVMASMPASVFSAKAPSFSATSAEDEQNIPTLKTKDQYQEEEDWRDEDIPLLNQSIVEKDPYPVASYQSPPPKHEPLIEDSEEEEALAPWMQPKTSSADRLAPVEVEDCSDSEDAEEDDFQPQYQEKDSVWAGSLPPISLLDPAQEPQNQCTEESLEATSRLLEIRLKEFGVSVTVEAVHPGPVITRFEIQPAPGIKSSRISNLAKDLARSLAVPSVRVVEVIPGRTTVGIEIPNEHRQIVRLSEVLFSEVYEQASSPVPLALGHDISGHPVVTDLARMPHLLVAGTTGSGKSVGVNAMILSILLKSTPDEARLIMIDPKMLELSIYEGIPHLLCPVVTDMKEAANALRWSVAEMERRYKLMAAVGVRNLAGFNRKVKEAEEAGKPMTDPLFRRDSMDDVAPPLHSLPTIVVIVDEFADMMMIVGKKVEELIARIAQKARAAGIHLILATQRPSVDVITGLIKANIPTRIAFQVSSKIDSRTILDQGGAEQLLGHGDMLYLPPGTGQPIRVHGAFVSDEEVHRIVDAWKQRGQPDYIEEILTGVEEAGSGFEGSTGSGESSEGSEEDPLYDDAVYFVTESRRASISAVQRKFKIGYNRAARMIEAMEEAGVVSSMNTNGSREVIAPPPVRD